MSYIYFKTRLCFMRHFQLVPEWRALSGLGSDVKAGSSKTNKSKPIFLSPPSLLVLKVCDGVSRIGCCDLVGDLNDASMGLKVAESVRVSSNKLDSQHPESRTPLPAPSQEM